MDLNGKKNFHFLNMADGLSPLNPKFMLIKWIVVWPDDAFRLVSSQPSDKTLRI